MQVQTKKNNTQPLDVFYAIIPKILPREVVNCKRASNTKFTIIIEARKHTHTHILISKCIVVDVYFNILLILFGYVL